MSLVLVLMRTPLRPLAALAAVGIPSLVVWALDASGVEVVGEVPSGLPVPELPPLSAFSLDLLTGAGAVAAIVLVQGAGVSESVPNSDGVPAAPDADFRAQGYANVASGLLRGLPVGGSLGQTALNVSSGARTRWASVAAGLFVALVLIPLSGLVAYVVMPALAALLLLAAWSTIDFREALSIWRTGTATKIVAAATFGATLFLPIQAAVGIGVVLSALIYLNQKQLRRADGRLYLSGVDHTARELIERTGKVSAEAAGRIFEATPILGESTERARAAAGAWLITPSGR